MFRKKKAPITIAASALVSAFVFSQVPVQDDQFLCGCSVDAEVDNTLPISHPANRCASGAASEGVNWANWLAGHSSGFQFHYLDLLELLTRGGEDGQENPHR